MVRRRARVVDRGGRRQTGRWTPQAGPPPSGASRGTSVVRGICWTGTSPLRRPTGNGFLGLPRRREHDGIEYDGLPVTHACLSLCCPTYFTGNTPYDNSVGDCVGPGTTRQHVVGTALVGTALLEGSGRPATCLAASGTSGPVISPYSTGRPFSGRIAATRRPADLGLRPRRDHRIDDAVGERHGCVHAHAAASPSAATRSRRRSAGRGRPQTAGQVAIEQMSADIATVEEVRVESIAEVLGQQRREQQGGRLRPVVHD